jgi:hypothetical protein
MELSEAATIWVSSSAMNCPNAMIPKMTSLRVSLKGAGETPIFPAFPAAIATMEALLTCNMMNVI